MTTPETSTAEIVDGLFEILRTHVAFEIHRYPDDYHTPAYAGRVYTLIELPGCEQLGYDQILKIAQHLGTTEINFQSAVEHGYYGEVDNIVRLWACWPEGV